MKQTWRWFGPHDLATIADIRQAGATGVVSALHHIANGEVWSPEEIATRKHAIETGPDGALSGLDWTVVESLPVSEDIKKQKGDYKAHFAAYRETIANLAAAGIQTLCYNFMPVLDWTRTELAWRLPNGGTAMRFDLADFAAFDIHLLARRGAENDYTEAVVEAAAGRHAAMDDAARSRLVRNIVAGLPGANEHLTVEQVRGHLAEYDGIDAQTLRRHLVDFLTEVVPAAERAGVRLCCHPDDPPFALMGLPRIASTEDDYARLLAAVDSPNSGVTLCTGSLGARPDNDLVGMARRFAAKIHFVHLRNVSRDTGDIPGSFYEAEHLDGDTDMVAVIAALLEEERRRKTEGRPDWEIPMRPDHGQDILGDLTRNGQPGYPIVGRLKGLAELRGVIRALQATA
jgi:mannonate dehydratase